MDVRYINPFLKAIQDVFDTMIQVPFNLGKPHLKEDKVPFYEVSSIIGLTGAVNGSVVVSLSKHYPWNWPPPWPAKTSPN